MGKSAKTAGPRGTAASFAQPEATAEREIVWRSGTGRVLRQGDLVKIDGLRGVFRIAHRQPWPDSIAVWEQPAGKKPPSASPRFVAPDRIHVRRAKTKAVQ